MVKYSKTKIIKFLFILIIFNFKLILNKILNNFQNIIMKKNNIIMHSFIRTIFAK